MISRSYAWIDESIEHSEADEARAAALAKKWSELQTTEENRGFMHMADMEDGRCYEPELEPCEVCGGDMYLGIDGKRTKRGHLIWVGEGCGIGCPHNLFGIKCPNPNCVDGEDRTPIIEYERSERERQAERDLEIELVEDKLEKLGARMMRPYEHWNEDERYMEYMENRGEY